MKRLRIFSLFAVMALLFALSSASSDSATVLLDFEDGKNPGFSKGGSCKYEVCETDAVSGSYALKVTERKNNAGVDLRAATLGVKNGDTLRLSFWVRQDSGETGFMSVSYTSADAPALFGDEIPSGVWTRLEGEFTYDQKCSFRFGTDDLLADQDFWIDDVCAEIVAYAPSWEGRSYGNWPGTDKIPSLKDYYQEHFLFGGEIAGAEFKDASRLRFCKEQFAILTPGNELKPDSVFDKTASRKLIAETGDETAVAVHLTAAKPFLDYCWENNIPVHGHTLLWHNQTPSEFFRLGYNSSNELADREIMLGRMENYIKAVMEITEENYPGLIMSWDVVNEAVDDGTGKLRTNVLWYQTVGPDYLNRAFEFARKYARPDVILCYNDYSTPYSPKLGGIVELLTSLVADGNIDCYGFQAHYESGQPSAAMVENAIKKISALGLKLRVSEMDIKIKGKSPVNYKEQADKYKELMDLFVKYDEDFIAVQVWGSTDDTSWLAVNYPLLFGVKGQPKPAFWALVGGEPEE